MITVVSLNSRMIAKLVQSVNGTFATTTRVGPAAHVATDEQYLTMRNAGALGDDVVNGAAEAILFERARVL